MNGCTRREFLKQCSRTGLAVGGVKLVGGCGLLPVRTWPGASVTHTAKVAAIRGRDLRHMVGQALDAIGGIESVVQPGEAVFIKPNCFGAGQVPWDPISTGMCTKPEITSAVAEQCLRAGAGEVTIGDAAQVELFSWHDLRTLDGSASMAEEVAQLNAQYGERTSLACLHADSPEWDPIPSPYSGLGEIRVSSLVTEADRIISVPVMKTHVITQITASLKNFVGVTPIPWLGRGGPWRPLLHAAPGGIEQCFLDLVAALKPGLAVLDMSVCCEGDGPLVVPDLWAATVDVADRLGDWLVLASTDLVAVDATAARIISHEAWNVNHIRMAYEQGLGQAREDRIEVIGADLAELRMDWEPAEHSFSIGQHSRGVFQAREAGPPQPPAPPTMRDPVRHPAAEPLTAAATSAHVS